MICGLQARRSVFIDIRIFFSKIRVQFDTSLYFGCAEPSGSFGSALVRSSAGASISAWCMQDVDLIATLSESVSKFSCAQRKT